MRILILSINYWPEETGIGAFTTYRAEYLAAAGHDVTVCTTFPYYPEWKVSGEYAGKFAATEERNGVRIVRSYAYVPNPVTSLRRVVHEASFIMTSLMRAIGQQRPDVLFVVSPPLGLALSAIVLSRIWRVPYVFEVEDLQPDAAADLGMLPPWALKLMYQVESIAYRNAALVSTLTEGMRAKIVSKGIPAEKVELFEPRADATLFEIAPEEGRAFRERHNLGQKFVVTHSGNMGMKQGLEVILEAASLNRDDDSICFLLVGDGAARKRIEARAQELKLKNVRFMPVLDTAEYRGLLAASDVCLVTQQKTVSDIVFPSKTVSYLAAGCAVVASVNAASEVARAI
ncbi:MAG TPA: glycosyltransferase family 4 protein, partial [Terriglobales bacterium]